jgi:3-phosphoshikimate 1-carboxyvinyltransferase
MAPFFYKGSVPASKSLFNRALIAQSFFNTLHIEGQSESEDVRHLLQSLMDFRENKKEFYCGDGGTTLRFLAARVSRTPGEYKISGSEQLFSRPHAELLQFFDQVGVKHQLERGHLYLRSNGWSVPERVRCPSTQSSQFLSAILLSSWDLPAPLTIDILEQMPSRAYLDMTMSFLKSLGLQIVDKGSELYVPEKQVTKVATVSIEPDMSSIFSLAGSAVMNGSIEILNMPKQSLQPDIAFLEIFTKMGITFEHREYTLKVKAQKNFKPIDVSLVNTPDLFPVLAVLLAQARGVSTLRGLQTLVHKESDRFAGTIDLLHQIGCTTKPFENGVVIEGRSEPFKAEGEFDPMGDHRMAMAAQVANFGGANLRILTPSVVNKSFPEFWKCVGVSPS